MKPRTKKILNFVLIFGTLAVVLLIGVNGQEMTGAIDALLAIGPKWIFLCLLAYLGYLIMDAFSVLYFLYRQGYPITVRYALFQAIVGLYYSNVTPGATGGQPMQVYYLKKRGVPIGLGTSAMTVRLFCFQFMLFVVGTLLWLIYGEFIAAQLGGNMWMLVVGYVYNAITVIFILMMAFSKRLVRFFLHLFIKVGTRLRICKDPEAAILKWDEVLANFHESIRALAHNPIDLLVQLAIGTAQLLSQMAVIYFVYHAFTLAGASYGQLTAMGVMLYTSAAYTPLPGASGAQEGMFALYFAGIFPDGIRLMALLLWRFFTYYLSLIVGAITTVVYGLRSGEKQPQEAPQDTPSEG